MKTSLSSHTSVKFADGNCGSAETVTYHCRAACRIAELDVRDEKVNEIFLAYPIGMLPLQEDFLI